MFKTIHGTTIKHYKYEFHTIKTVANLGSPYLKFVIHICTQLVSGAIKKSMQ